MKSTLLRKMSALLLIMLNLVGATTSLAEGNSVYKELNKQIVTDYHYYDLDTEEETNYVDVSDHIGLKLNFAEQNGVVIEPGDTLTLTLPSYVTADGEAKLTSSERNLEITDGNGTVIGHLNSSGTEITITFTDAVKDIKNITGSIDIKLSPVNTVGLESSNEPNDTIVSNDLGTGLGDKTITIHRPESGETSVFYYKTGHSDDDHYNPKWFLSVNPDKVNYTETVKIQDTVLEGHKLKKNTISFNVTKSNGEFSSYTVEEFESKGFGSVTFEGTGFTATLFAPVVDYANIDISYNTHIENPDQDTFENDSVAHFPTSNGIEGSPEEGVVSNHIIDNLIGEGEGEGVKTFNIKVLKVDSEKGDKVLEGASFDLKNDKGETISSMITNETGIALFEELDAGEYDLVETIAPIGYELDTTPHHVTLVEGSENSTVELTIENKAEVPWTPIEPGIAKGQLQVTKVDSDNHEKVLEGAEFKLSTENGKVITEDLRTDMNGKLVVTNLDLGNYILEETKAPKGYDLLSEPIKFEVTENDNKNIVELTVENTKTVPWTPIEPGTPTVPWTPVEPAAPTVPWTPIEPAAPIDSETPADSETPSIDNEELPQTGESQMALYQIIGLLSIILCLAGINSKRRIFS